MKALSLQELEALLDVHGPELERWPLALQAEVRARRATDPQLAALFAEAQALATWLDTASAPPPSPELQQRILRQRPVRKPWLQALSEFWSELGGLRRAGPVLACGLALGVLWPDSDTLTATSSSPDLLSIAQLNDSWDLDASAEQTP